MRRCTSESTLGPAGENDEPGAGPAADDPADQSTVAPHGSVLPDAAAAQLSLAAEWLTLRIIGYMYGRCVGPTPRHKLKRPFPSGTRLIGRLFYGGLSPAVGAGAPSHGAGITGICSGTLPVAANAESSSRDPLVQSRSESVRDSQHGCRIIVPLSCPFLILVRDTSA